MQTNNWTQCKLHVIRNQYTTRGSSWLTALLSVLKRKLEMRSSLFLQSPSAAPCSLSPWNGLTMPIRGLTCSASALANPLRYGDTLLLMARSTWSEVSEMLHVPRFMACLEVFTFLMLRDNWRWARWSEINELELGRESSPAATSRNPQFGPVPNLNLFFFGAS